MVFSWDLGIISKVTFLVFLMLLLTSCDKKESYKNISISVHAASGLYNPRSLFTDNTIEAVNYALGFKDLNGIEIDIQYSRDGTLWMFHDELLDGRTDGEGVICSRSDEYLETISYKGINSTKLSKLLEVDWSAVNGEKIIYLDFKNLNTLSNCENYDISNFLNVLEIISSENNHLMLVPVIDNKEVAEIIFDAGYEVYSDVSSYSQEKALTATFYSGFTIRQKELSASEIYDIQSSGKNVILFDIFSLSSLKKAFKKAPYGIMAEDFKSAILERN
ncbi:MAG: glycerophosphodiester phosphodiesterase family protein [Brumimicrobium sp.]